MEDPLPRYVAMVLVTVGVLLAYPGSLLPAAILFNYFDWGSLTEPISDCSEVFYSPLALLPEPMLGWLHEWDAYCDGIGRERL